MARLRKGKLWIALSLWQIMLFCGQCAVAQQTVEQRLERYFRWMETKDVWTAVSRMEELGEKATPAIKRQIPSLPEVSRVACAKVLITLGEVDYSLDLLMGILENANSVEAKILAAQILGIYGDFELEDRLNDLLESSVHPHVKIALAKTLWQVARNPQASRILNSFLKVEDPEIRYAAALALAEINDVDSAKTVLSGLKDEPTLRGRLARALLEQEVLISRYERLLESQGSKVGRKSKYPVVEEVLDKILEYHVEAGKFDGKALIDAAVKGMVRRTDIHSAFWTEKEWSDFVDHIVDEQYVGIGVYVGEHNDYCKVISPIYSGPAYRAGIRSRDRILAIDGWQTAGRTLEEIVDKIRGEPGTPVRLKIARESWEKEREIDVCRENIQIPTLYFEMLPGNIGYIRLTQFGSKANEKLEEALQALESQGMKGLVLDLRGNAGGWLQAAVDVVDKFLAGRKLIVYSQGRHPVKGQRNEYYSTGQCHPEYPIVILVDESTASASEIVAGSLQHYGRVIVIGVRTYGKGSVQEPLEILSRPGTRLKLTIAYYYLPDGTCIHNEMDSEGNVTKHNGVAPDIEVPYEKWEPWQEDELSKLEEGKVFETYLQRHYEQNRKLFHDLAENDSRSVQSYPGFSEWYESLGTKASTDDVRRRLRALVRRRVADERGRAYTCDYLEDIMLQRAVVELCARMGTSAGEVAEFRCFAERFHKQD